MEKVWKSTENGFSMNVFIAGSGVFAIIALMLVLSRAVVDPPEPQNPMPMRTPAVSIATPPPAGAEVAAALPGTAESPAPEEPSEEAGTSSRDSMLWALADDEEVLSVGQESYQVFCYACHAGPEVTEPSPSNLFDTKWYHGGSPTEIEVAVRVGVVEKGMPGWDQMIPDDEVDAIVAYLLSFQSPPESPSAVNE